MCIGFLDCPPDFLQTHCVQGFFLPGVAPSIACFTCYREEVKVNIGNIWGSWRGLRFSISLPFIIFFWDRTAVVFAGTLAKPTSALKHFFQSSNRGPHFFFLKSSLMYRLLRKHAACLQETCDHGISGTVLAELATGFAARLSRRQKKRGNKQRNRITHCICNALGIRKTVVSLVGSVTSFFTSV